MKISNKNTFKLGTFVLAGLILFAVGIYYLGKQQNLFRSSITVMSEFKNVKGLKVGNSVRFLGINAGSISDITISNDTIVLVEMQVDKKLSEFIRKNAKVEIENEGVMGTKILTIHPGAGTAEPIEEKTVLPSVKSMSIEEVFGSLEETVQYSTGAAKNLMEVTQQVKQGEGALGKLIYDRNMSNTIESLENNIEGISFHVMRITQKINQGDGDLSRLVNNSDITDMINEVLIDIDTVSESLKTASAEIEQASSTINHGDGIINKALYDSSFSEDVDTTVVEIKNSVDDIIDVTNAIEESWLINLFSGDKKEKKKQRKKEKNPENTE